MVMKVGPAMPGMTFKDYPHVAAAIGYCERVTAGQIVTCEFTKLACQRQLDDLARKTDAKSWPYYFDPVEAEKVCRFIERLPHVKGKWARRSRRDPTAHLIRLEPWQSFSLTTIFGWMRRAEHTRRFNVVYEEVARKNAKSTKCSGVAIYVFTVDKEPGAEIYVAATKRAQAQIVFGDAQKMLLRSDGLRIKFDLSVRAHEVLDFQTSSLFRALDAKRSTQDGLGAHCVINDELHAYKSRELYDVLHSSMSARDQPLEYNITTAGSNRSGVCYELRHYLIQVSRPIPYYCFQFGTRCYYRWVNV